MLALRLSLASRAAALLLVASALAAPGRAQGVTFEELRDALREGLRRTQFAAGLNGLVLVSDELELSGARFTIDRDGKDELSALSFPFQRTFREWDGVDAALYLEGVVGYARDKSSTQDVFAGALPGSEAGVVSRSTVFGALVGAGPEFRVAEGLTFAPLLQLGLSRIENDADYSGPGAATGEALLDGLAFNWSALALTSGAAARLDWVRPLSDAHALELVGRFDARWTRTLAADDPAQEFTTLAQFATLRSDVTGPTGLRLLDRPLRWRTFAGYRRFTDGELFGVHDFVQLGGSLSVESVREVPVLSSLEVSAAIVVGRDIEGWTAGIGGSF